MTFLHKVCVAECALPCYTSSTGHKHSVLCSCSSFGRTGVEAQWCFLDDPYIHVHSFGKCTGRCGLQFVLMRRSSCVHVLQLFVLELGCKLDKRFSVEQGACSCTMDSVSVFVAFLEIGLLHCLDTSLSL